jgi:membrane associated rhomboid family serine protease
MNDGNVLRDASFSRAEFAAVFSAPARRPWMTWVITMSILCVYVAQLFGMRHQADVVGSALAVGPEALFEHRYWTLLTYAWAHAVPNRTLPVYAGFHLVTNIVPLFCVAPALERRRGPWWLLTLFCGGAVASAWTWLAGHPGPGEAMIGASGAIFALIAAGGVLRIRLGRADFVFFQLPLRLDLRWATVVLCALEAAQMFWRGLPDVAHAAHLGGALFGAAFALVLRREAR